MLVQAQAKELVASGVLGLVQVARAGGSARRRGISFGLYLWSSPTSHVPSSLTWAICASVLPRVLGDLVNSLSSSGSSPSSMIGHVSLGEYGGDSGVTIEGQVDLCARAACITIEMWPRFFLTGLPLGTILEAVKLQGCHD